MKARLLLACFTLFSAASVAQQFDVNLQEEPIRAAIGETIQTQVRLQNNDSKSLTLVVRKIHTNLGSTQKTWYCLGSSCNDAKADEQVIRLEAYQSLTDFTISLDAGLAAGVSSVRYAVYNKFNLSEVIEFELNFTVEEKETRQSIYNSKFITLHDVYPNPAVETAQIDYKIHRGEPAYSITVRNLLGNIVSNYQLSQGENKLKMRTDDLNTGIYFFTLYIDNEGVMTRKMIVKK